MPDVDSPWRSRFDRFVRRVPPRLGLLLRWVRTPLGCLVLVGMASALCGLYLHERGFVAFFCVVAVTLLGIVWPWFSTRGLEGKISCEKPRCREGEGVGIVLTLKNRMPWAAWGVRIQVPHDPSHEGLVDPLRTEAVVPGWTTTTTSITFVPQCRGEYPSHPPRISSGFPFGLRESSRPLEVVSRVLVWPRTVPIDALPDVEAGHSAQGLSFRDRPGDWGDPLGVRRYRRGDPLKRVHWAQTARHGELIVCELQSSAVPRVLIVLDTDPAIHGGKGPDGSLEWSIRVAASFAEEWTRQGADVALVHQGGLVTAESHDPRRRVTTLLDALARLAPNGSRTLEALLHTAEATSLRGGLRLIITTDTGGSRLEERELDRPRDRWVVLESAGFGGPPCRIPLAVRPWIWIEGPSAVASRLRFIRKEVPVGC